MPIRPCTLWCIYYLLHISSHPLIYVFACSCTCLLAAGTLFRFPLRSAAAAAASDIKPAEAREADVHALLAGLRAGLPAALLFLRNVICVQVRANATAHATAFYLDIY